MNNSARSRYSSHKSSRKTQGRDRQSSRRSRSRNRSRSKVRSRSRSRSKDKYKSSSSKTKSEKYNHDKKSEDATFLSMGISSEEIRKIAMNVYEEVSKEKLSVSSIIKSAAIYETPKPVTDQPRYKVNYNENSSSNEVGGYVQQMGQLYPVSRGQVHKISEEQIELSESEVNIQISAIDSTTNDNNWAEVYKPSNISKSSIVTHIPPSPPPQPPISPELIDFSEIDVKKSWEEEIGKSPGSVTSSVHPYINNGNLLGPTMIPYGIMPQNTSFAMVPGTSFYNYPHETKQSFDVFMQNQAPQQVTSSTYDKWIGENISRKLASALEPSEMLPPASVIGLDSECEDIKLNQAYSNMSPFGARLMKKMGWHEGEGLGKGRDGTTSAIIFECKNDRKGLTSYQERYEAMIARKQKVVTSVIPTSVLGVVKNPISALNEFCQKNKLPPPIFNDVKCEIGTYPLFRMSVTILDQTIVYPVSSTSKKDAKNKVAQLALEKLGMI